MKTLLKACPHCGENLTVEQTEHFITEACESCLQHWSIVYYDTCCRNPEYEIVLLPTTGAAQVRKQCKNCGAMPGGALGGYTPEQKAALQKADKTRQDEFYETSSNLRTAFFNKKQSLYEQKRQADSSEWWAKYNAYLNSPAWQRKRTKVLQRDNYLCQACLIRPANEVHHKSYEFVMQEPCFDLVSLCNECHNRIHEIRNQRKAS